MGYTHYFKAKNPVLDLLVNHKAYEDIWYNRADLSGEKKALFLKRIEQLENRRTELIKKYLGE